MHHCMLESDTNGCWDLYASLNHKKYAARIVAWLCTQVAMTALPTCSKHRGILQGFCKVEVIFMLSKKGNPSYGLHKATLIIINCNELYPVIQHAPL